MRHTALKKTLLFIGAAFCLSSTLLPSAAYADSKPYFKAFGSDVFTGGSYVDTATGDCPPAIAARYQIPGIDALGGIKAFAKSSGGGVPVANGGASSQFAIYSLGLVEGDSSAQSGFYSKGVVATSPVNSLTFANTPSWGGKLQGAGGQNHCIPDYFGTMQKSPATYNGDISDFSVLNGQYIFNNPAVTTINSAPVSIRSDQKLTLFINGNAYIGANITYGAYDANNVPKFALVVKGSIYIAPGVTQLDGLYIAQPAADTAASVSADTGVIWDCHPRDSSGSMFGNNIFDSNGNMLYVYPTFNCQNDKLTVNGAFVAKQLNMVRVKGDVASANTSEDNLGNALGSANIADLINYTPAMAIGGGFFQTPTPPANLRVDSLVSLPPVF